MSWRTRPKAVTAVAGGLVALLALAGCGSNEPLTDESGRPIVTVQVVKDARAKPLAEMPWTADLEEACGCSIVWQETASSTWDQQRQASLAAGEVADVTIGGYGSGDWGDYSSLFMELTPELENMPALSRTFDDAPYSKVASTWEDKLYGAPNVNTGLAANSSAHMFINQQWLDELGLPVPTTWEELETALVAFKEEDPNGNGEADEIPMDFNALNADGWGWFQPNVLLGSHGIPITGGGLGMYAEDGTIKNYLTDPAYQDLARYMHGLWSQGLISNEAFTQDWSKYTSTAKGNGDMAKVGVTWMWTPSDIFGSELADQYVTIPSLSVDGETDAPAWFFNGDQLNYGANRVSVAAEVKNKEAALKLVDAMYTPDISVQMRFGSFGIGVEKNGEKDYTVLEPADDTKNASDWQFQNSLADGAPGWVTQPGVTITLPSEHVEVRDIDAVYDQNFENMDLNGDVIYGGVSFTADENREYALNNTGISQTAMSKFAQWVTEGGVDDEWDTYVADLENNGLNEQVTLQQQAYDRYVAVMEANEVDLNTELNSPDLEFISHEDGSATLTNSK